MCICLSASRQELYASVTEEGEDSGRLILENLVYVTFHILVTGAVLKEVRSTCYGIRVRRG